jgi:DNA-directed RNA polymerase specialized sigma24 family protein
MRYKEIGEALSCNPKTAESRVRLGLDELRQALRERGVEAELEFVDQWA